MNEQELKNLIAIIEDSDYIVMWNDGYDKYIILNNIVHDYDDELRVNFQDFSGKYVDLHSCVDLDFLAFRVEK